MLRSTLGWPALPVTLAFQGVTLSFSSPLVPGTRNFFVTKWVHIKHYGLKLGGPCSRWLSASFSFSKDPEIPEMGPQNPRGVISEKKKAPARKHPVVVRMGFFIKNHWFPGFGWKDRFNPKDEMIKNDASYPLECPKPIILCKKYENQGNG